MAITPLKVLVSKVVFGSFICTQSRYNLLLASAFHVRTGKEKKIKYIRSCTTGFNIDSSEGAWTVAGTTTLSIVKFSFQSIHYFPNES